MNWAAVAEKGLKREFKMVCSCAEKERIFFRSSVSRIQSEGFFSEVTGFSISYSWLHNSLLLPHRCPRYLAFVLFLLAVR